MYSKIFPTIIIILNLASCCFYIPTGNWRMVLYWFAAAILNFVVTY